MRTKKTAILPNLPIEILEARIAPANLAFAIGGGSTGNQSVQEIGVDAAGNTYVTGKFQGNIDFDPGPDVSSRLALAGDTDSFVAKYTSTGALAWVDVIRATNEPLDTIQLAVAANGDAFIVGKFGNAPTTTLSFSDRLGPPSQTLTHLGSDTDIFVAKIGTSGDFQWVTQYSSNSAGLRADDIATDSKGGIYMVGSFLSQGGPGSVSFGGVTLSGDTGENDLFVVKLLDGVTPTVAYANETSSTGSAGFERSTIAVDTSGEAVIAGSFTGSIDLASIDAPFTLTATSPFDNFVAHINPFGIWDMAESLFARGAQDSNPVVALEAGGNIFIGGSFSSPTDFDPGTGSASLTPAGLGDAYLLQLDYTGSFLSVGQFGGAGNDSAGVLLLGQSGDIYFGGGFAGAFDMDPGAGINMSATGGVYFLKFNSSRDFVDAIQFDSSGGTDAGFNPSNETGGGGFALDTAGGLHIAGTFRGVFDVNPGTGKTTLTSKGGNDFFVASYFHGNLVAQDLQTPVLAESFALGGLGDQTGGPVITDAAGNLYLAGLFSGTVDFDRSAGVAALTSSDPEGNVFIAKYDLFGALSWARQVQMSIIFDNNADDLNVQLALDAAGNVYVAAEYDVSATLGAFTVTNSEPSPTGSSRDIFIAKLDSNGTPLWAKSIGSPGKNDLFEAFAVRASTGDVLLGGDFSGTVDFNPAGGAARTAFNNGGVQNDGYIVELDTTGAFRWVRQLEGAASQISVSALGFLSGGDVVASGSFSGTIDFNFLTGAPVTLTSVTNSPGEKAGFAARFTAAAGAVVWTGGFGGSSKSDHEGSLAVSATDEIFIAGQFTGARDFDPGNGKTILIESGGGVINISGNGPDGGPEGDVFLQKLDQNGVFLGAVSFGGTGGDRPYATALDGTGSLYILGKMGKTIDLDPGPGIAKLIGSNDSNYFVGRFDATTLNFISGYKIAAFNPEGDPPGNKGPGIDASAGGGFWIDADGNTYFSAGFVGSLDLDPAGSLPALTSKGAHDIVVVKLRPENEFDAAHPRTFHDSNGDIVTLKLTGPGTATYILSSGGGDLSDLGLLKLSGTNRTTTLTISITKFGNGTGQSVVQKILTTDDNQSIGKITLGSEVKLGDGENDTDVDLLVSGALNALTLGDVAPNTLIKLGTDLPYSITTDTTTPDTYNNRPTLTIRNILGAGVDIRVLGADADAAGQGSLQGVGGGGFGNVTIGSWGFSGYLRTTQSIGNFTIQNGDFLATLEIDKFGVGEQTQANVGQMNIANGAWGGSGNEIEGAVKSFNADAFLAGATITASTIGSVKLRSGAFDGTITLTDAELNSVGLFTVDTDFTGNVVAAGPLKKLKIKGDFMGSLTAPSIGSITAFSFLGTTTGDTSGDPTKLNITTTTGALGTITATAGIVDNYEIDTALGFKGFNIVLKKLAATTVGIDGVKIHSSTIGNISVNLAASAKASGVNLTGIRNSEFVSTGSVGNVIIKLSGQSGASLGLDNVKFSGASIGKTHVTVTPGKAPGSTARSVDTAEFLATGAIGTLTFDGNATSTQVTGLKVSAGGKIGAVSVKSKTVAFGSLVDSAILAGQSLLIDGTEKQQKAALTAASLGAVSIGGSLINSKLVAGANIGAVKIGASATDSLILAGAKLGGDFTLGDNNETFQRAAAITSVTVGGAFTRSSIVAGIASTNATFGDADDALAAVAGTLAQSSSIGALKFGAGSGTNVAGSAIPHTFAIQAAAIKSLANATSTLVKDFTTALFLDAGAANEDANDVLVRLAS